VAGDPFFLGDGAAERSWSQRMLKLKYELRLPLDDSADSADSSGSGGGRDVAVGSFNFHEQHFAKAFEITDETDEPVFTGCAGFGLERLAYAFLCRHGVDPRGWPEDVRAAVAP
jgi:seryl-tRNA synthetase